MIDADAEAQTDWATEPIPPGRLLAYVWWCGDDYCNCSEAQILVVPWGKPYGYGSTVWSGEFHTDGEPGASTELNREARRLRRHHHDLYRRIEWPWDRRQSA